MPIKKLTQLKIPDFDREGNEKVWRGKPLKDSGDLPVCYTKGWAVAAGYTILYESPNINKSGTQPRVPCIIIGGNADLITTAPTEIKEKLDAIGILHLSGLQDGVEGFYGLPMDYHEDIPGALGSARDPEKYIGGRILYITDNYHITEYDEEINQYVDVFETTFTYGYFDFDVPLGSNGACAAYSIEQGHSPPWSGGLVPSTTTVEYGPIDATRTPTGLEQVWLDNIRAGAARCDKYLMVAQGSREVTEFYFEPTISCYDGSFQHDNVPDVGAEPILMGDDSLLHLSYFASAKAVFEQLEDLVMYFEDQDLTNEQFLEIVVEFFELE